MRETACVAPPRNPRRALSRGGPAPEDRRHRLAAGAVRKERCVMRPHIGQRLRALIAGASLFTSASARADEPLRLDFWWEAPDGCPERAQVIAEIEKLVGRTVTGEKGGGAANEDGARLSVRAVVTRAAGGLSVDITSPSNGAVRDRGVEAPSCKEVASAAAREVRRSRVAARSGRSGTRRGSWARVLGDGRGSRRSVSTRRSSSAR